MTKPDDPLENVQRFALSLSERINDLLVRVEALRRSVEPLGVSREIFDQHFHAVFAELSEFRNAQLAKAVGKESDARIRQLLESIEEPKQ